jgi:hypothetical protein
MKSTNLHKIIMRRVYYSYGLSVVTSTVFWQGIFLGMSAILLAHWLNVASCIRNFLAVPVGAVPHYVTGSFVNAINHGELLTALTLVLAGIVAVQVGYRLAQALVPRLGVLVRV